jgi:hypothetical protein
MYELDLHSGSSKVHTHSKYNCRVHCFHQHQVVITSTHFGLTEGIYWKLVTSDVASQLENNSFIVQTISMCTFFQLRNKICPQIFYCFNKFSNVYKCALLTQACQAAILCLWMSHHGWALRGTYTFTAASKITWRRSYRQTKVNLLVKSTKIN